MVICLATLPIYACVTIALIVCVMYVDSGPERLVEKSQLSLYIRRWWPSTYEIGPFSELILDDNSIEDLRRKVCETIMDTTQPQTVNMIALTIGGD